MDSLAERGIAALRAGDRAAARALLSAAVRERPENVQAWLWLSGALEAPAQQRYCLERVLALDPGNEAARRGLEALRAAEEGHEAKGGTPVHPSRSTTPIRPDQPGQQAPARALSGQGWRTALPWLSAALAGVSAALAWGAWARLGEQARPEAILAVALVGGAPLGLTALMLGGVLLRTSGRWLGGRAGAAEVRAALGWAAAPAAWSLLLWGAQLTLLPAASFGGAAGQMQRLVAIACAVAHGALWLWSAARGVRGLAEVQGIGSARAVGAWLLAALIVVATAFAALGGAALVISLRGG